MALSTMKAISESENSGSMELVQASHNDLPTKLVKVSILSGTSYAIPVDLWTDLIVDVMRSYNETKQFHAAQGCRHLLDFYAENPPIDLLISKGIVSRCIGFITCQNPAIQFEALWSLTNITAGTTEHTMFVINNGAIPKLVNLLKSPITEVAEQAAWTLGNIAGDGPEARDRVLEYNCMPLLLSLIKPTTSVSFTRNIIRTIANLCKHDRAPPPFDVVRMALPALNKLLKQEDPDISADASRALLQLNEGADGWVEGLQNTLEEFQLFFSIIFYAAIFYVWIVSCFEKVSLPANGGNSSTSVSEISGIAALQEIRGQGSHM